MFKSWAVDMVYEVLMLYVPTPPDPEPKLVITVSKPIPMPYKDCPTLIVPSLT